RPLSTLPPAEGRPFSCRVGSHLLQPAPQPGPLEGKAMSTLRVCSVLAAAILAAASTMLSASCSAPARSSSPPAAMDGGGNEDAIRLSNGEVVRGRILEETPRQVVIERETVVSTYPRAAIFSIDYAKERWQERRQPLLA